MHPHFKIKTMKDYAILIARELGLQEGQVRNVLELLDGGATIPFIARYRKEATDSLDEVQIGAIRDRHIKLVELDKRRAAIIDSVNDQGKLTDELRHAFENASNMTELEDLYLPYRPKRKTRASVARERGLEPLAALIMSQKESNLLSVAKRHIRPDQGVETAEDAIAGGRDIIAEWIAENIPVRTRLRSIFVKNASISARVVKGKEREGAKYETYFNFSERIDRAPSHRILAMFRAEEEGFLHLTIAPDESRTIAALKKHFVKCNNLCGEQVSLAVTDSYKRLLQPQMETEMRKTFKEKADREAINVFVTNLRQLLLAPPLGQKVVLAIDPGFRTGCKVVILNPQGQLMHNETIYPHPPKAEYRLASDKLKRLVLQYKVEAIAIGNGTAGRETEYFVSKIPFERDVQAVVVNESGASVYSASQVARDEFPDYDVTVRGAVSIGRRLMDPLAELVKIDPKSIGVGQYQHDVNQTLLQESLNTTVESCVNYVGVEVNTASKELLARVSGIGPILAKNIIDFRNEHGPFTARTELRQVPRFGEKAFEQAAGFLRIRNAANPLDSSAVHPESYHIVDEMARRCNCSVSELISDLTKRQQIHPEDYVTDKVGLPTLNDIMQELAKPGRDPRTTFDVFEFDKSISTIQDLKIGMSVPGIVTNITNFGCFVDIGVHQDGLVHISQLADHYVSNPNDVVKLNQKVMVTVTAVDMERKRISLSMKGNK